MMTVINNALKPMNLYIELNCFQGLIDKTTNDAFYGFFIT